MNAFLDFFASPEWTQLVKALLHTLWQGAIVAGLLALALRFVRNPAVRYRCSLIALLLVLTACTLTWASFEAARPDNADAIPREPALNAPPLQSDAEPPLIAVASSIEPLRSAKRPWTAWCALIWIGGAGLMLLRAGSQLAGAERLRRSSRPLQNDAVAKLLLDAQRALHITRKIRIVITEKLTSPAVVGVLIPTLVLPLSLVSSLSHEQIRFILLHELAHIRRHDYLLNLLQLFAEALLFFNPAVWWISHQIRREREVCCDALAIDRSGAPAEYAKTLLQVAEHALRPIAAPAFGGHERSSLSDRIQRLLVPGYRPALRLTWRAMAAALMAGSALLLLASGGTRIAVAAFRPAAAASETSPGRLVEPLNRETNLLASSLATVASNQTAAVQTQTAGRWALTSTNLETRVFAFDPQVFYPNLRRKFSIPPPVLKDAVVLAQFPDLLGGLGIHIGNAFLKDYGLMMLHGSREDLDKAEKLIAELNGGRTNLPWPQPPKRAAAATPEHTRNSPPGDPNGVRSEISSLIQNGRFSYEAGNPDDAKAHLEKALAIEPGNEAARFYLNLVTNRIANGQSRDSDGIIRTSTPVLMPSNLLEREFTFNTDRLVWNLASVNAIDVRKLDDAGWADDSSLAEQIVGGAMFNWFRSNGVEIQFTNIPSMEWNYTTGILRVRATPMEMNKIAALAIRLNTETASISTNGAAIAEPVRRTDTPSRQIIRTSDARREIMTKLQKLRIAPITYQAKPFGEVVWDLQQKTREADPEGKGIQFTVSLSEAPTLPTINPATGLPEAPPQTTSADLNSLLVTIRPLLSNVPIMQVLDALVEATGKRIKWSITENGVVFSPKGEEHSPLHIRTFKLNWRAFTTGLHRETGARMTDLESGAQFIAAFTNVLAKRGIRLQNVFCNPRTETVWMRGAVSDLELAEKLLNELTYVPPQVNVRTRFFSVPENRMDEALRILGETNVSPAQFTTAVLQEANLNPAMLALEKIPGVTVLMSQGDVTTLSGRQAQIQMVDLRTLPTGINPEALNLSGIVSSNGTSDLFQLRPFPLGPTLDVVASASDDGKSMYLRTIASVTEFLGYEKGSNVTAYVDGAQTNVVVPLPKFRIAQASAEAAIADCQTLVLISGPKRTFTRNPGQLQESASTDPQDHRLIAFVTPTLIDAAGNRVNPPAK